MQGLVCIIYLGLNARKFLKFIKMNRENFISFITDSVAVKKNLVDARLVENRQADTIQKYLDSLDDESLETLCIQQGYSAETESTITTAKAVQEDNSVAFLPSWKQFEAECDGACGKRNSC
jgi:hypothetical protein